LLETPVDRLGDTRTTISRSKKESDIALTNISHIIVATVRLSSCSSCLKRLICLEKKRQVEQK